MHRNACDAPPIPTDIASDFVLGWHRSKSRWVKKVDRKVRFFGLGSCPKSAHAHWQHFQQTGEYVTPTEWGKRTGQIQDEQERQQTARRRTALPMPEILRNTPLKRHAVHGTFYAIIGGKQHSFPRDPDKALAKYQKLVAGKRYADTESTSISELYAMFLANRKTRIADDEASACNHVKFELSAREACAYFGPDRIVNEITPQEWTNYRSKVLLRYRDNTVKDRHVYLD
jgi:hypothetical protein